MLRPAKVVRYETDWGRAIDQVKSARESQQILRALADFIRFCRGVFQMDQGVVCHQPDFPDSGSHLDSL